MRMPFETTEVWNLRLTCRPNPPATVPVTGQSRSPLKGRRGRPDDRAGLGGPVARGAIDGALQALARGFQLADELRREVAALVDARDEVPVRRDRLGGRVAGARHGGLGQGGLAAAALQRRLRLAQVRQRPLVLGDAPAVEALQAPTRTGTRAPSRAGRRRSSACGGSRRCRPCRARPCGPSGRAAATAAVRSSVAIRAAVSSSSRSIRCRSSVLAENSSARRSRSTSSFLRSSSSVRSREARLSASSCSDSDARGRPGGHGLGAGRVLRPGAGTGEGRGREQGHRHGRAGRPRSPASRGRRRSAAEGVAEPVHGRQKSGLPSISLGTGTPKYFSTVGPMSITPGVLRVDPAVRDEQARDRLVVEPAVIAAPLAGVGVDDLAGRRPAERRLPRHAVAVHHARSAGRARCRGTGRCRCRLACRRC